MASNTLIAFFAAIGAAMFIYSKTSRRGTGDFKKQIAPAAIVGLLTFMIALSILATIA
jgi:hypothetical protein